MNTNQLILKKRSILCMLVLLATAFTAHANTFVWQGGSSSSWSDKNNWYDVTSSATASAAPSSSDDVTFDVSNIHYVTGAPVLDAGDVAKSLTIASGSTITVGSGYDLTVSGNISGAGTLDLSANSGTVSLTGDFTIGTLTPGTSSTVIFNGTSAQNITANAFRNINISNTSAAVTTSGNITVAGTMTVAAGAVFSPGSGNTVGGAGNVTGSGTINVSHTGAASDDLNTQYLTSLTLTNLTVNYVGTANQKIGSNTFGNLSINNSGNIVTLTAAITVAKNVTIGSGGTLDVSATNFAMEVDGNFTNSGTFNPRSGTVTLNGTGSQTIGTNTFNNITVSNTNPGITFTGSPVLAGSLSGIGKVLAGSSTLTIDGDMSVSVFIAGTSNVIFAGAGSQSIGAYTFNNLQVNNSGVVLSNPEIVNGNLSGTGNLQGVSLGSISVGGNMTIAGYTPNTSTIVFNGSSNQNINSYTFYDMTLNNTAGVTLVAGDITISDVMTVSNGKLTLGSNNLIIQLSSGGLLGSFSSTKYIKTNGTGHLEMNASTTGTSFPVGFSTYNPIIVKPASIDAVYDVSVADNVTNANNVQLSSHAVNATWTVTPTSGSQSVTVTPQWNASQELASFDRTHSFVAYRTNLNGPWTKTAAAAAAGGSNPYTLTSGPETLASGNTYYFGVGDGLSPLPVTLVAFNARFESPSVYLDWQTASEQNNSYFGIERSIDGVNWIMVGSVPGHGNSQTLIAYSFIDNLTGIPAQPVWYYRLKQVDFNGEFAYSDVRSVSTSGTVSEPLTTWPNPASNMLNFKVLANNDEQYQVMVVDQMGKTLYNESFTPGSKTEQTIDISGYLPGMYFVKLNSGEQTVTRMIYKR